MKVVQRLCLTLHTSQRMPRTGMSTGNIRYSSGNTPAPASGSGLPHPADDGPAIHTSANAIVIDVKVQRARLLIALSQHPYKFLDSRYTGSRLGESVVQQ